MKSKTISIKPIKATTVVKGIYAKAVLNDIEKPISEKALNRNESALSMLNKLRG